MPDIEVELTEDSLHIPALLSEQLGWPRSVIRAAIGLGKVQVDGDVYYDCDISRDGGFVDITIGTFMLNGVYYNPQLALEMRHS